MGLSGRILAQRETLCLYTNRPTQKTSCKQHNLAMTTTAENPRALLLPWLTDTTWLAVKTKCYPWTQTNTKLTPNCPRGGAESTVAAWLWVWCLQHIWSGILAHTGQRSWWGWLHGIWQRSCSCYCRDTANEAGCSRRTKLPAAQKHILATAHPLPPTSTPCGVGFFFFCCCCCRAGRQEAKTGHLLCEFPRFCGTLRGGMVTWCVWRQDARKLDMGPVCAVMFE